jgi:hypothetical protein
MVDIVSTPQLVDMKNSQKVAGVSSRVSFFGTHALACVWFGIKWDGLIPSYFFS